MGTSRAGNPRVLYDPASACLRRDSLGGNRAPGQTAAPGDCSVKSSLRIVTNLGTEEVYTGERRLVVDRVVSDVSLPAACGRPYLLYVTVATLARVILTWRGDLGVPRSTFCTSHCDGGAPRPV